MTHPNSLENLKLGAAARRKGKVKLNLTVLPTTADKLKRWGNASRFVELLLEAHEQKRLLDPREILELLSEQSDPAIAGYRPDPT
jgi:hypothetical protein